MRDCCDCYYEKTSTFKNPCKGCLGTSNWKPKNSEAFGEDPGEDPDEYAEDENKKPHNYYPYSVKHYHPLPDSGERRSFKTGSVRDVRIGKGRYDLISPFGLYPLAKRLEDGMSKYGERNWEKGQNLMSYLDSAERHINQAKSDFLMGVPHKEDHIGAAMWNLHAYAHTLHMIEAGLLPEELDDRPFPSRLGLTGDPGDDEK